MSKRRYWIIKPVGIVYGVYSKDFGSEGGYHLIKTLHTEEEANEYVRKNIIEIIDEGN